MKFEKPPKPESNDKKDERNMTRREFLKKLAIGSAVVLGGAALLKTTEDPSWLGKKEEKIETIGEGLVLNKEYEPAQTIYVDKGKTPSPTKYPIPGKIFAVPGGGGGTDVIKREELYILDIKINESTKMPARVSKEQFESVNVGDKIPIKTISDKIGTIYSIEVLNRDKK